MPFINIGNPEEKQVSRKWNDFNFRYPSGMAERSLQIQTWSSGEKADWRCRFGISITEMATEVLGLDEIAQQVGRVSSLKGRA